MARELLTMHGPEQQKQKPRAGSSLPAALSKGDAEVWGQTDPLSSNPRGKGEALLRGGGGAVRRSQSRNCQGV